MIEDEQISYTGRSTHNLTGCTRGVNNTTAATHADGSGVKIMRFVTSVHASNNTYRIQDVGGVLLSDVISCPKGRGYVPAPAEITIELRS